MEDISNVHVTEYIPTIYTRPCTFHYTQNGKQLKKDILAERHGVLIILYNKTRDVLVLVKQFRASVYLNQVSEEDAFAKEIDTKKYPADIGVTLEFCAGLEDKTLPTEDIAIEEVYEECGYKVGKENLEKIAVICNMTVTTGSRSTFFYCEVTDDMRVSEGGGVSGENIEVIEMKVKDVVEYSKQKYVPSPVSFLFGLNWFLYNKYNK